MTHKDNYQGREKHERIDNMRKIYCRDGQHWRDEDVKRREKEPERDESIKVVYYQTKNGGRGRNSTGRDTGKDTVEKGKEEKSRAAQTEKADS